MNKQELIDFETEIGDLFNAAKIRAPIHLYANNEENIMRVFEKIDVEKDWVCCTWRNHYQALLKGVPAEQVKSEIISGRSISLCFPEHRVFSSAIVGGHVSIAVGIALSEKKSKSKNQVWCFLGDMTSETGVAQTSIRYAETHDLPITFVIEDNGLSVLTDTRNVWASSSLRYEEFRSSKVVSFKYKSKYPHAGAGVRVQF